MTAISRIRVSFTGSAVIGPSSTSFWTEGQPLDVQNKVKDLWQQWCQRMPPSCIITVHNTGETYELETGLFTEFWSAGTSLVLPGTGQPTYTKGVGVRCVWETAGVTGSRRVRGSTFVVPVSTGVWSADGDIETAVRTHMQTAADAYVVATATTNAIWSRPIPGRPGHASRILSAIVPDKVATLRSRRT